MTTNKRWFLAPFVIFGSTWGLSLAAGADVYCGHTGGVAPPWEICISSSQTVTIEAYQPIKGEVLAGRVDSIDHLPMSIGETVTSSSMTVTRQENGWMIKSNDRLFGAVTVSQEPVDPQYLDRLRNRAFLHEDAYRLAEEVRMEGSGLRNAFQEGIDIRRALNVEQMADTMNHSEFLSRFQPLRKRIKAQLLSRQ